MARKRKYIVEVKEQVQSTITVEVTATSRAAAAQAARDAWVCNGEGEQCDQVIERWTEIDGEVIYSEDK